MPRSDLLAKTRGLVTDANRSPFVAEGAALQSFQSRYASGNVTEISSENGSLPAGEGGGSVCKEIATVRSVDVIRYESEGARTTLVTLAHL